MRRPHWRKMTWALIVWSALILIWAVSGAAGNSCSRQKGSAYLSAHNAAQACQAGTGIGVALILIVGFFGFVLLSLIWFMSRPRGNTATA